MMSKKAQGLPISAVILIILGVIVLVVLVVGFGWGWNTILPWLNPSSNLGQIDNLCKVACTTQNVYDYCNLPHEIKGVEIIINDAKVTSASCKYLVEINKISPCPQNPCPA